MNRRILHWLERHGAGDRAAHAQADRLQSLLAGAFGAVVGLGIGLVLNALLTMISLWPSGVWQ